MSLVVIKTTDNQQILYGWLHKNNYLILDILNTEKLSKGISKVLA